MTAVTGNSGRRPPATPVEAAVRRRRRGEMALPALSLAVVAGFAAAVGWGAVSISPAQLLSILASAIGIELPWTYGQREETVLLAIRLPRAVLAVIVGSALAVCGAALQGLFRNPLADPALIGVSAGAALGAGGVIVLGSMLPVAVAGLLGPFLLPLAAFGTGLATMATVYRIASRDGRTEIATLLLAGVAINAIAGAGLGLLVFVSADQELRDLNFWLLGSLGGVTWKTLLPVLPLIVLPALALPFLARHLDALLLGEEEAHHLGFDVERTKRLIVILVALPVGASVALTGVIGFVGLVIPHLIRMTIGPGHRLLLPASMLAGSLLLLGADLVARTIVLPAELPIGILTSCLGGPFFLWLLFRRRALAGW